MCVKRCSCIGREKGEVWEIKDCGSMMSEWMREWVSKEWMKDMVLSEGMWESREKKCVDVTVQKRYVGVRRIYGECNNVECIMWRQRDSQRKRFSKM